MIDDRFGIDLEALRCHDDPWEIDDINRPHLAKHPPFTEEDLGDVLYGEPLIVRADPGGRATCLLIGPVPGDLLVVVPLAPAEAEGRVRPIGIYVAHPRLEEVYRNEF